MLIAADEQIPGVRDLLGDVGDVRLFAGRAVTASDVADADALVVRSVTRVDEPLLSTSRVRFVGTTTSGTDHVNTAYLASRGIAFADAAGSNARPVAEYVLTSILLLADRHDFDPRQKTLGVVGVGWIGSIVADWAESLGMTVLRCDPPLAESSAGESWVSPGELLAASDIITLHVPLAFDGPHPTAGMVDAAWLAAMRPGAFVINTSRGAIAIESALLDALVAGRCGGAVLDVWLNEPCIDALLAARCEIATPHIAGQSFEAKRRAAAMIREALVSWSRGQCDGTGGATGVGQSRRLAGCVSEAAPSGQATQAVVEMRNKNGRNPALREMLAAMLESCDLLHLDARLRGASERGAVAKEFDALRSQCGARHEFTSHAIDLSRLDSVAAAFLRQLGFCQSK